MLALTSPGFVGVTKTTHLSPVSVGCSGVHFCVVESNVPAIGSPFLSRTTTSFTGGPVKTTLFHGIPSGPGSMVSLPVSPAGFLLPVIA